MGFRETESALLAGYVVGRDAGSLRGEIGLQVGGGFVTQHRDGGGRFSSATASAVPLVGVSLAVSPRGSLRGERRLAATGLKLDGDVSVAWLWGAYAGVSIGL
jgi:hypothetical protein